MQTILELVKLQRETKNDLAAEHSRHEKTVTDLAAKLTSIEEQINFYSASLDLDKVNHGLSIVKFGNPGKVPERHVCISDAIDDLLAGSNKLKKEYFGTKNYDRWKDQRSDHGYGYGPRHGSIVFKVELFKRTEPLTEFDIECAIYCLLNAEQIFKAKEQALTANDND